MMYGIDIGTTFTKVCIHKEDENDETIRFPSILENLSVFLKNHFDGKKEIKQICVIGSGSHKYREILEKVNPTPIFADEIKINSDGILRHLQNPENYIKIGGKSLETHDKFIVAALGTGASFSYYENQKATHIGGTGIGGGTFLGLCKLILGISDYPKILELAKNGKSENVDLMISDLVGSDYISTLTANVVASSMAKAAWSEERPKDEDLASSLLGTLAMSIGCHLAAACTSKECNTCVLVGGFLDYGGFISNTITSALNLFVPTVTIIVPKDSQFIGAIGAAYYGK
ncbi:Fumble family protein [Tritrichomonas foetus]|uniref:Fumble family protein n=1 Tax=Tritrichomonas foetus TaxID=1144522 RepID=A0A1J4K6Q4_9EUKA|nr:Fumble family protein [Tritrichomonas foetus]|eukprot:OHT07039.1 Fumble family protein [Tritrichomonas foetus]